MPITVLPTHITDTRNLYKDDLPCRAAQERITIPSIIFCHCRSF